MSSPLMSVAHPGLCQTATLSHAARAKGPSPSPRTPCTARSRPDPQAAHSHVILVNTLLHVIPGPHHRLKVRHLGRQQLQVLVMKLLPHVGVTTAELIALPTDTADCSDIRQ